MAQRIIKIEQEVNELWQNKEYQEQAPPRTDAAVETTPTQIGETATQTTIFNEPPLPMQTVPRAEPEPLSKG